jgi:peptide chain release factor 1
MLKKLEQIEQKYKEISQKMSDPAVLADQKQYALLARTHSELQPLAEKIGEFRQTSQSIEDALKMKSEADDRELAEFFDAEIKSLSEKKADVENKLRELLVTRDPNDEKDIIMEIRAGAGGDEAALFAADLYKMYTHYGDNQRFKSELISSSSSDIGGFKEIIFSIQGKGAYSKLKFESGVHRVQRVPATESSGRIHTSTATVAVLPEVKDVEVDLSPNDLRIDIFRSSGPGGQSVNTTDSAVRITHLPTGLVVSCQDQKSQLQNKEQALRILRARLYERMLEEQMSKVATARRLQVGTGDRSERIRTYNFPQGRVTDHRIGLTLYKLEFILNGEIEPLIEGLAAADRAEKLQEVS